MTTREHLARGLAAAFLASDWTQAGMLGCAEEALGGRRPRWVEELAERARLAFPAPPHHDDEALTAFIAAEPDLGRQEAPDEGPLEVRRLFLSHTTMAPGRRFEVPELPTPAALAAWLGRSLPELDWLADRKGLLVRAPVGPLQHYHPRWIPKANGSRRLLEVPKEVLKGVQQRLLRRLLGAVPPHDAAHAFRRGRNVASFAAPHAGQALVLRMDLRDFFPSIGGGRVQALFRALGYPRAVATLLTGLVTTRTPLDVLAGSGLDPRAEDALRRRHLPQGAPTSPALSNLCAFGLDVRLSRAAAAASARYSRYADDLAFSGGPEFRRQAARFRLLVVRIAAEEGFAVRWEKNRWMTRAQRQRLAGLVVNERPRPGRAEYERLRAILHNCARTGPAAQNRAGLEEFRAHLRGRVAWFEQMDSPRGARLRARFERIVW